MGSNARRLAKNTIYMYIRMFILMLISLYTSRVLLRQLGVSDYGIYNVVGSIVIMFNSLRGIFASSTQRYLNIEKGKGNSERLNVIFNMSLIINLIIALLFIIGVEIVGWWFLNYKINIDSSRLIAAKWVFQFSVFSAVVSLLTTSYDAVIIANERMGFYAGMSVLEGILRLGVIFLLALFKSDKLITYAFFLLCVQILVRFINSYYCRRNFAESHYKRCWNRPLFKDMASFAGWNFLANTGYTLSNEGINMLLNVFGGPIVNAARGITYQVRAALETFIGNVNKATDPHAMKLYAKKDFDSFFQLMFFISKLLFFAYVCVALPVFFYTDDILLLWLGQVPEYTSIFIKIIILHGLVRSYIPPFNVLFYSANKVKYYQICSLIISSLIFVTAWVMLSRGLPVYVPFVVMLLYMIVFWIIVLLQAHFYCEMSLLSYLKTVVIPTVIVLISCIVVSVCIKLFIPTGQYTFLCSCFLMVLCTLSISFFVGFTKADRKVILGVI